MSKDKDAIYKENGFESRRDYLESLATEYGVDETIVFELASVLGRSEDFDGLVTELEDMNENDPEDEW